MGSGPAFLCLKQNFSTFPSRRIWCHVFLLVSEDGQIPLSPLPGITGKIVWQIEVTKAVYFMTLLIYKRLPSLFLEGPNPHSVTWILQPIKLGKTPAICSDADYRIGTQGLWSTFGILLGMPSTAARRTIALNKSGLHLFMSWASELTNGSL